MTQGEFINRTIEMIKQCQCTGITDETLAFKLKIEKNNIKSITITVQVLLIFEELFGYNFMFNKKIRGQFDFGKILKYLNNNKENYLRLKDNEYSRINVSRCAYCGIGLLLLNEEESAREIANLLCKQKINNEYAWGLVLSENVPDILSTYIVTMLLNRLHISFSRPTFLDELFNQYDNNGIPFNGKVLGYKYIEALTLVLYMDKFYYFKSIEDDKLKLVNGYYYNGIDSICDAKENYFKEHPLNQWRIYGFGLASKVVTDLKNPFYEYVLEHLTRYFDKPQTNIPYVLEICRMYNAIKNSNDPFREDKILNKIKTIETAVKEIRHQTDTIYERNQQQIDMVVAEIQQQTENYQEYNREVNIKIPIATAFVVIYFLLIGVPAFFISKWIALKVINMANIEEILNIIGIIVGTLVPIAGFICKKTRILIVKLVDKFYRTFNIHKKDD